jgi:hypothetical protein
MFKWYARNNNIKPEQTVIDQGLPFVEPSALCFDQQKGPVSSITIQLPIRKKGLPARRHLNSGN